MNNKSAMIVPIVFTVLFSLSAAFFAFQANKIAEQANELVYKSNLPCISAVRKVEWNVDKATETITISNVGHALGPPYEAHLNAYIEINRGIGYEPTYLPLAGYYGDFSSQATGNSYGLILIGSSENNSSNFQQIENEFMKVASNYMPTIRLSLIPILTVTYTDFTSKVCYDYYKFVGQRLEYVKLDEYNNINVSANRNYNIARLADVNLTITGLDGVKLWEWYRNQIIHEPK
ncbi:MAG: hypothetical protein D4R82_05930 [Dehalococcoidia bacterium]|nr:MAG: hypothetical protein D4R82_05930 [Dehalococcoidia bacterium]